MQCLPQTLPGGLKSPSYTKVTNSSRLFDEELESPKRRHTLQLTANGESPSPTEIRLKLKSPKTIVFVVIKQLRSDPKRQEAIVPNSPVTATPPASPHRQSSFARLVSHPLPKNLLAPGAGSRPVMYWWLAVIGDVDCTVAPLGKRPWYRSARLNIAPSY